MEIWIMEIWNIESLKSWKFGKMGIWKNGNLEKWKFGNLEIWKNGTLEKWNIGKMEHLIQLILHNNNNLLGLSNL